MAEVELNPSFGNSHQSRLVECSPTNSASFTPWPAATISAVFSVSCVLTRSAARITALAQSHAHLGEAKAAVRGGEVNISARVPAACIRHAIAKTRIV